MDDWGSVIEKVKAELGLGANPGKASRVKPAASQGSQPYGWIATLQAILPASQSLEALIDFCTQSYRSRSISCL
jgi:hypothetical protein